MILSSSVFKLSSHHPLFFFCLFFLILFLLLFLITRIFSSSAILVIVIVNSRFLERPQKRSRGNQLIHRRLTKTKSLGSGQDPESQAGRQTVRRLWCMVFGVETGMEGRGRR